MSKELASEESGNINFKVNNVTGEAYASQRATAKLCGVSQTAVFNKLKSLNVDSSQGLTPETLQIVITYFAVDLSKGKALKTLSLLAQAGAKAFIYAQAGVQLKAISKFDEMRVNIDLLEAQEIELIRLEQDKADKADLTKLANVVRGTQCPNGYLPKAKLAVHFDVNPRNKGFLGLLEDVRQCSYPFASGTGGLRQATAYNVEDLRIKLEE